MAENKNHATEEQIVYGRLLNIGMKIGMAMLLVTFSLYMFGVLEPHIPVEDLPQYWVLSVGEYLEVADVHTGWSWLNMLNKGDFVNFLGVAFLSGVTIVCYMRIIPILIKKGDKAYAILAIVEVLVLVLAASGVLKSGGH